MAGRVAAFPAVAVEDGREVERLSHHAGHEVRHMPERYELVQRRRQQPALIDIPGAKHLGQGQVNYYSVAVETLTRTGS